MNIKFNTEEELYNKLLPAIKTKKSEIRRTGLNYILEEDIWNALKLNKWQYKTNLSLDEMADDILNTDNDFFDSYVKKEISKLHRTIISDNDIL